MKNKRALSFLMALVLCLSLLPFGAFADEAETIEPEAEAIIVEETSEESTEAEAENAAETEPEEASEKTETAPVEAATEESAEPEAASIEEETEESSEIAEEAAEDGEIVDSGSCGADATWTLDSEGTLTISGTGAIDSPPWSSDSIKKVIIKDGVTSIGDRAFCYCTGLTSVTLGSGVTSIGWCAFEGCSSLTGVTIPNSVTSIGDSAFEGCSSLTSINIPDSVISIGSNTFSNCSSLTNISIPNSVKSIGYWAFCDCSSLTSISIGSGVTSIEDPVFCGCSKLTSISVSSSNKNYSSQNDILYNKSKTKLICCPARKTGSVTIPSSVTSIAECAFLGCSSLTGVTIPKSVTSIQYAAFCGCSNLKKIAIPNRMTKIDKSVFQNCSSLTSITIPSSVTGIDEWAFAGCSGLTDITVRKSVTSIGACAFLGCFDLADIYYNGSETAWNNIDIGVSNASLTYATIHYNSYTVTYYANGGTGAPAVSHKTAGTSYTISSQKPTRTGYTFQGWATSSTATTAKYKAGKTYSSLDGLTLYAVWKAKTYTVTYNANGGSDAPNSQTKTYGKALTLRTTKPTRTGYTFLGWSTSKTATTATYKAGGSYTKNAGATLYAVWRAKTYTVKYYANGGSGAPASGTKTYGQSYTIPSTKPTRTGYTFQGWATSATATTAKYLPGKSYTTLSSFKLYAVWKKK